MKFNIADPTSGGQKMIEVDDDAKIRPFLEKRMGQEVDGESLGQEYKGYIFKITGGNDAQGFPMKQGIMRSGRIRILFKKKGSLFNPKRTGYRRRRSVRGCITASDLGVMSLKIMKKGDAEIAGCTDKEVPSRLFKKRKSNIAAVFGLDRKKDNVCKYVARREIKRAGSDKTHYKAPKVQRLITEKRLRRKKIVKRERLDRFKTSKENAAKYEKLISQYVKEKKAARSAAAKEEAAAKAATKK
jgi:small subunit ribosomal protein S6e